MEGNDRPTLGVVVPTRNRPVKLAQCLDALDAAREFIAFSAYVGDSSTSEEMRDTVREVCSRHPYVTLAHHDGDNISKARNFITRMASEDVLASVDDDVRVEPEAVATLYGSYERRSGPRVVAGTVRWGDNWSRPQVRMWTGHTRPARSDEPATFLIGAFILYPRRLALAFPWNERIRGADDIYVGTLWNAHGVLLAGEDAARAHHHPEHNRYPTAYHGDLIYTLLFDAVQVKKSIARALSYEMLGFAVGAKQVGIREVPNLTRAWIKGNRAYLRDRAELAAQVRASLPAM